jgi:hypothetical protein
LGVFLHTQWQTRKDRARPGETVSNRINLFSDFASFVIYFYFVLCYWYFVHHEKSIDVVNVVYLYFRARVFYNIILGALVVASNHWVLIGSNDLHRFWDVCYVGHADNIKKHLWLQHIVTSNVFHGYVILIAHDRRGDASQDPVGVSTGCAHFTSGNAILRILTVVWNS